MGIAISSVLLEPLLMAAAALIVVLLGSPLTIVARSSAFFVVQVITSHQLINYINCSAIHPLFLNCFLRLIHKVNLRKLPRSLLLKTTTSLRHYPITPLLGELGFLGLRSSASFLTILVIQPLHW